MFKELFVKYKLKLAIWLFDSAFDVIDSDDDGKITKDELLEVAEKIDTYTQKLVDMFQR